MEVGCETDRWLACEGKKLDRRLVIMGVGGIFESSDTLDHPATGKENCLQEGRMKPPGVRKGVTCGRAGYLYADRGLHFKDSASLKAFSVVNETRERFTWYFFAG